VEQRLEGEVASRAFPLWKPAALARRFGNATKSRLSGRFEELLNVRKAQTPETANGCTRGGKLWRANPMSGSGMKQGQQARGG
jgi:hypothetical protein